MKSKIFQIAYNAETCAGCDSQNTAIIMNPPPCGVFFENRVIDGVDAQIDLRDVDAVSILSYAFEKKTMQKVVDFKKRGEAILSIHPNAIVVPNIVHSVKFLSKIEECHPGAKAIMETMFDEVLPDYDKEAVGHTFYCNFWMMPVPIFRNYVCEVLRPCMNFLEKTVDAYKPGHYSGSIQGEAAIKAWGFPYYTYHTFICERLPAIFAHHHNIELFETSIKTKK